MPNRNMAMLAIAGALVLGACGGGADGNRSTAEIAADNATRPTTFREGFDKGFADHFKPSFVPACIEGAARSGLPADKRKQVCDCAADDLTARYTPRELDKLSTKEAMPSMNRCIEQAGLSGN